MTSLTFLPPVWMTAPSASTTVQAQHVVARHAVLHAAQAARVLRQVAADGADLEARRVGRVEQAVLSDAPAQLGVDDPRLAVTGRFSAVDLEHRGHARHHDRQRPVAPRWRHPTRPSLRHAARAAPDAPRPAARSCTHRPCWRGTPRPGACPGACTPSRPSGTPRYRSVPSGGAGRAVGPGPRQGTRHRPPQG